MSTKIYNGMYVDNMSIKEFNDWCLSLRKRLIQIAIKQYYKGVANIAQSIFLWQKSGLDFCPYYKALDTDKLNSDWSVSQILGYSETIANRLAHRSEATKMRIEVESDFDYQFSLSVFPTDDKILLIPYTENEEFLKCLVNDEKVHSYPYYDNADAPSDITDEEWEERGRIWDSVFAKSGIPAECGMTVVITDSDSILLHCYSAIKNLKEYIIPNIKSEAELRKKVARQQLFNKRWLEIKSQTPDSKIVSRSLEISEYYNQHSELVDKADEELSGSYDFASLLSEYFSN